MKTQLRVAKPEYSLDATEMDEPDYPSDKPATSPSQSLQIWAPQIGTRRSRQGRLGFIVTI